jgi:tRNA pseudouridine38-40 synthase
MMSHNKNPIDPENNRARRIRLTVAYDGTDYLGWQYQPEGPTVQGFLEKTLKEIQVKSSRVTGAGRTDAGVHALGLVAHFDTDSRLGCTVIERALNALLPKDIRVRETEEASPDFHARYSASARCYRYSLADSNLVESVLLGRAHWVRPIETLEHELLNQCAALLPGEHDFLTFSSGESHRQHHLCTIYRAEWSMGKNRLFFRIEANRFLRRMVRMLVGAMIAVAEGRAGLDDFRRALETSDRMSLAVPAPAEGLTLVRVEYPENFQGTS